MQYNTANPYLLNQGELPRIKGIVKKANPYEQTASLKGLYKSIYITWSYIITYALRTSSNTPTTEQEKRDYEKMCDKIISGQSSLMQKGDVLLAGLNHTTYLEDMTTLAKRFRTAKTAQEFEKLVTTPFPSAIIYLVGAGHWQNWEIEGFPNTGADQACSFSLDADKRSSTTHPFDILRALNDSVNWTGDAISAVEASSVLVDYLQTLPEFSRRSILKETPSQRS